MSELDSSDTEIPCRYICTLHTEVSTFWVYYEWIELKKAPSCCRGLQYMNWLYHMSQVLRTQALLLAAGSNKTKSEGWINKSSGDRYYFGTDASTAIRSRVCLTCLRRAWDQKNVMKIVKKKKKICELIGSSEQRILKITSLCTSSYASSVSEPSAGTRVGRVQEAFKSIGYGTQKPLY